MKRVPIKYSSPTFIIGLCLTGLLGVSVVATKGRNLQGGLPLTKAEFDVNAPSQVLELVDAAPEMRLKGLEAIAADGKHPADQSRARYLLAMAHLESYEGSLALEKLENLEDKYPILAAQILIKRGRAYELTNDAEMAKQTWLTVVQNYQGDPAAAEALYRLSAYDPKYADQAIAQYPAHPRTQTLIQERLKENPQQPKLLVLRLLYDGDAADIPTVRQNLIENYAAQLTPEIWQAIADQLWDTWKYEDAAKAYEKSSPTAQNLYRLARGFHLDGQETKARNGYKTLIKTFPKDPETGLALRRLASILPSGEALPYLDQAYKNFPDEAANALLDKANILERLGSSTSADQARKMVLNNFKQSEATSDYRWEQAEKYFREGRADKAWEWAQPIAKDTPDHTHAPESLFWIGKWAATLNRPAESKAAFTKVITDYPESYFAWRAAGQLGWDVGDFTSVRDLQPQIEIPNIRPLPPAGSEAFQELFRLGQDFDAWNTIQMELAGKNTLTINEEFTAGLLKITQGHYLKGINTIWNLSQREAPGDRQAWLDLRQRPDYWYALFPFPYADEIQQHSKANKLNPLLVVALMRQESRFEKDIQSPVGATGLMQVMPGTAEWIAAQINDPEYAMDNPADNIQFGTWYLRYTHSEYDNNSMLAVASYNAGPGNVAKWVNQYGLNDLDIFVEEIPFKETKGYVESVFANYWNYQRLYNPTIHAQLKALGVNQ